jgi:hypothetical protein
LIPSYEYAIAPNVPVIIVLTAIVGAAETVYVPIPPLPVPKAVILVPAITFVPVISIFRTILPVTVPDTVNVKELIGIEPVNEAPSPLPQATHIFPL